MWKLDISKFWFADISELFTFRKYMTMKFSEFYENMKRFNRQNSNNLKEDKNTHKELPKCSHWGKNGSDSNIDW